MNNDEFLDSQYMEEIDRHDYDYNDVWNPNFNPDGQKNQINTTGIELDTPQANNQISTPQNQKQQIQPKYFHPETGRLLIPDGTAKRLAQDVYQELMSKFNPVQMKEFATAAKRLMTGLHLNKDEVDGWVRDFSPTLANIYDEFVALKRNDEDILDFGSAISTILSIVLKAA